MNEPGTVSKTTPSTSSLRTALYLLPAFLWAGVIFALSQRQTIPTAGLDELIVSSLGHLAAYAILGSLLFGGLLFMGLPRLSAAVYAIGIATIYGLLDEVHQSFVPGRHAGPEDLVLDFIGATVAVVVLLRLTLPRKPPSQ